MKTTIKIKWILIFVIGTGLLYINEILKQPGDSFAEKYNNLVKQSNMLLEKAKKGEL